MYLYYNIKHVNPNLITILHTKFNFIFIEKWIVYNKYDYYTCHFGE